jgi:hypothetical protein
MQTHIAQAFTDIDGSGITHFVWSDGAWVSFNAMTRMWESHGFVAHPTITPDRFGRPLTDIPYHTAEVAIDD